jgi:hypothetical protein
MLRSLLAELFPTWYERRLVRRWRASNDAGLAAREQFQRRIAMADKAGSAAPGVATPETGGLRHEKRDATRTDRREAPVNPKSSGAAKPGPDTSKSRVANRDTEGPRKASTTPRPTDKPI